MVIAPIVASAAVESATKEDGLVNQAFKITILIALALAVGTGLYLIYTLTNVFSGLIPAIDNAIGGLNAIISLPGAALSAIFFSLPFGRGIRFFQR